MKNTCLFSGLSKFLFIFTFLFTLGLAGGCSSSSSSGSNDPVIVVDLNPDGYYSTGSASVGDGSGGTLSITDLQAIVHGNRIMAMSVSEGLLYDGTISVTGDALTATVTVYKDGLKILPNVSVTATVVEGDSISGTLGGTEQGSGTFSLQHSMDASVAAISRVQTGGANPDWNGPFGGSTSDGGFTIDASAVVSGSSGAAPDGNLEGCRIYTVSGGDPVAVIPVNGTNLYDLTIQLGDCVPVGPDTIADGAGYYTGFATTRSDSTADDTLVFMVTNATHEYAVATEFH